MSVSSWIRRQFSNGVITTGQLAGPLGSSGLSFALGSGQGATFPTGNIGSFIVTVGQGLANEEKILCSSRSGDTFTVASGGRGYNGGTAQNHISGEFVLHTIDAQDLDEANQVAVQTLGAVVAQGDLLQGSGANALQRLARGAANSFLQVVGSTAQWTGLSSATPAAIAATSSTGVSTNLSRDDHTHSGVTTVNGSAGAVTVVTSLNGGTGALSQTNGYGISGANANPPVPAVALTSAAGSLGSPYTVTNTLATFLTTSSLGIGTWLVTCQASLTTNGSAGWVEFESLVGTATATLAGCTSADSTSASALQDQVSMAFIATVTVAGTLVFQAKVQTPGGANAVINSATPNNSYANATGYTATRIA